MSRLRITIALLIWVQNVFAQDTLKVEPIEFGFPEVQEIGHSIQEQYGQDSVQWPIWLRKRIGLNSMRLNTVFTESLMVNDTVPLMLDEQKGYTVKESDSARQSSYQYLYYQGDFIFAQVNSVKEFYSMKKPMPEDTLHLSAIVGGKREDLSCLSSLKIGLPESYDWRNIIPSWATYGFFTEKEQIHLTVVRVLLTTHKDVLVLVYYHDKLVFAHQDHYE